MAIAIFGRKVHVERDGLINGPEEPARRAVRELIKMRADVIKLLVTGGVMTDGSDVGVLQRGPDQLQAGSRRHINWAAVSPGTVTERRV